MRVEGKIDRQKYQTRPDKIVGKAEEEGWL